MPPASCTGIVSRSVGRMVGRSVCQNILKGREVTLPFSYQRTCLYSSFLRIRDNVKTFYISTFAIFFDHFIRNVFFRAKPKLPPSCIKDNIKIGHTCIHSWICNLLVVFFLFNAGKIGDGSSIHGGVHWSPIKGNEYGSPRKIHISIFNLKLP